MGFFNKEVELIVPPKQQNNKTVKVKSLNGYDAIREKIDEGNTMTVHASALQRAPVLGKGPQQGKGAQPLTEKPKTKVSIGL